MTDRNIPITEDELHAYVDNELPAERRSDVETWLATHPEDAERVRSWRTMADELQARYGGIVNEPVPKRLDLDRLVREPRRWIYGTVAASMLAFVAGGVHPAVFEYPADEHPPGPLLSVHRNASCWWVVRRLLAGRTRLGDRPRVCSGQGS